MDTFHIEDKQTLDLTQVFDRMSPVTFVVECDMTLDEDMLLTLPPNCVLLSFESYHQGLLYNTLKDLVNVGKGLVKVVSDVRELHIKATLQTTKHNYECIGGKL
jgi:hypothetical protein